MAESPHSRRPRPDMARRGRPLRYGWPCTPASSDCTKSRSRSRPDPRYLFMSERHAEALAHLLYGVKESGGFIQLTGEVGTGKTTLVRSLLQQLPDNADVALILNPQLSRIEFLCAICEELGVPLPEARGSIKALTDALNRFLLENHSRGRRTILIVDEAQNLRARRAGAGAPAHQSRNHQAEAAADHPDRPAGTARAARPQRHAPARPAHHRALPPRAAVPRRGRGLHRPPREGRRRRRPHLRQRLAPGDLPARPRHSPHDQRDRGPGAARRLHRGVEPGDAATSCAGPPPRSTTGRPPRCRPGCAGCASACCRSLGLAALADGGLVRLDRASAPEPAPARRAAPPRTRLPPRPPAPSTAPSSSIRSARVLEELPGSARCRCRVHASCSACGAPAYAAGRRRAPASRPRARTCAASSSAARWRKCRRSTRR